MGFWYRIGKDIAGYLNLAKQAPQKWGRWCWLGSGEGISGYSKTSKGALLTQFVENLEFRILDKHILKQFLLTIGEAMGQVKGEILSFLTRMQPQFSYSLFPSLLLNFQHNEAWASSSCTKVQSLLLSEILCLASHWKLTIATS